MDNSITAHQDAQNQANSDDFWLLNTGVDRLISLLEYIVSRTYLCLCVYVLWGICKISGISFGSVPC